MVKLPARVYCGTVPAGTAVVREGEPGDRFYVVDKGEVEILVEGEPPRREGEGTYFGEIALLRDVPRTATVRALEPLRLFAVERDDFLVAVTGHDPTLAVAENVVTSRLPAGALAG